MQQPWRGVLSARAPGAGPPLIPGAVVGAVLGAAAAVLMVHAAPPHPDHPGAAVQVRVASSGLGAGRLDPDPAAGPVAASAPAAPSVPLAPSSPLPDGPTGPTPAPPAAPAGSPAPAPVPAATASDSGLDAWTLSLVNDDRAGSGLPALSLDPALARAAVDHAAQNAAAGRMSHDGVFTDVARQGANWHSLGECLGQVRPDPDAGYINSLWMQSSEHRPIILGSQYTRAGVGWAQAADGDWFVSLIVAG